MTSPDDKKEAQPVRGAGKSTGSAKVSAYSGGARTDKAHELGRAKPISPRLRRALILRIQALEAEQRADASAFDALYDEGDRLLARISDRQISLRAFRQVWLNGEVA